MKLIVSEEMRAKFPKLKIAVVMADLTNDNRKDDIDDKINKEYEKFISCVESVEKLNNLQEILEWREVYREFGINPKKKKPSAEAFLSRVLKNNYIPKINPAVDAYLVAETLHCLPIGGYDLDKIDGDIYLTLAKGNESFVPIKGEDSEETKEGEVIYKDNERVLTRCWNYRDCDYSQISACTKRLALFVEAPNDNISTEKVIETAKKIEENLIDFCDAKTKMLFLDEANNELII